MISADRCIRVEAAVSVVEAKALIVINAATEAGIFAEIKVANPGAAVASGLIATKTEIAQGDRGCAKIC